MRREGGGDAHEIHFDPSIGGRYVCRVRVSSVKLRSREAQVSSLFLDSVNVERNFSAAAIGI